MLQEPPRSAYDLQFNLLGFPVRVAWGFWLVAAILGWNFASLADDIALQVGADSPGRGVLLLIWIVGVFLSILVHELGHTLAFRFYGMDSQIVLYHFGGLAIPGTFGSWNAARRPRIGAWEQLVISAAGPGLQLLLGLVVWGIGLQLDVFMNETRYFNWLFGTSLGTNEFPGSAAVFVIFGSILFPSFVWAILNLIPILPLDGGQILRSTLTMYRVADPLRVTQIVSVFFGGLLGLWLLSQGRIFGIMLLLLAANNWQAMQYGGRGF
jgi:stage IV sporulation protein FB